MEEDHQTRRYLDLPRANGESINRQKRYGRNKNELRWNSGKSGTKLSDKDWKITAQKHKKRSTRDQDLKMQQRNEI